MTVTQHRLSVLARKWEPEASASPQTFRLARCASCGHRIWGRMVHAWLHDAQYKKELHLHRRCARRESE